MKFFGYTLQKEKRPIRRKGSTSTRASVSDIKLSRPQTKTKIPSRSKYLISVEDIRNERDSANYVAKYTAYGQRAVDLYQSFILGDVLPKPIVSKDEVQKEFLEWANGTDVDFYNRQNLYGILLDAVYNAVVNGECFLRKRPASNLVLQTIDPYQIPVLFSDKTQGIKYSADGKVLQYNVEKLNYNTYSPRSGKYEVVQPKNILHCIIKSEGGAMRGRPFFKAILDLMAIGQSFDENAAKNAEASAGIFQYLINKGQDPYSPGGADSKIDYFDTKLDPNIDATEPPEPDNEKSLGEIDVGDGVKIVEMPDGTELFAPNSRFPNASYGAFTESIGTKVSAGVNIPHFELTSNYSAVNYSAGQLAKISNKTVFAKYRRVFENQILNRVYKSWLGFNYKRLGISTDETTSLYPQGWEYSRSETADPQKHASAYSTLIGAGMSEEEAKKILNY